MLFGSKQSFAIEALSEPELRPPSSVWGRMQIWCLGHPIGDISDEHCALYPAYLGFKALQESLPSLWLEELESLTVADFWNHLDGLLFGYHGDVEVDDSRTVEECQRDWHLYGRFNFLTNWGEQFDRNGKSFIACPPTKTVLVLNRSLPNGAVEIPLPAVMLAIRAFVDWFESEALRLRPAASA